jgi:hypothetical protein
MSALGRRALRPYLRDGAGRARRGPGGTGTFGPAALLLPAHAGKGRRASPSSRGQDAALSRRKRGFNSPWGRQQNQSLDATRVALRGSGPVPRVVVRTLCWNKLERRQRHAHRVENTPLPSGLTPISPASSRGPGHAAGAPFRLHPPFVPEGADARIEAERSDPVKVAAKHPPCRSFS